MIREMMPPVPQPGRVRFTSDDYLLPVIGLCGECIGLNLSASCPVRASPVRPTTGSSNAWDIIGERIVTPRGLSFLWTEEGIELPAGGWELAEVARLFTPNTVQFREGPHVLDMYAVTVVDGTMVCATHAVTVRLDRNGR
ncbi:hypothetical protein OG559_31160 (plasmid) [Micromonospora sp. NBC_01405]|uniref:hypothetical protein n=1 Tax=Micromonospora sp. NBC_01405 TaxID=2903589 RepID=UPI00324A58DD